MLHAKRVSIWKNRYEVTADGQALVTWEGMMWKTGGTFELDGRRYEIRANLWGNTYKMVTEDGTTVASVDNAVRTRWTVEGGGQVFEFQRASMWRREDVLQSGGRQLGSIKRTSTWRGDTVADLPGLPAPMQVFALIVAMTKWDAAAGRAGTGGAAAGGLAAGGGGGG